MYNLFSGKNTIGEIPRFVRAASPQRLEQLMLSVQLRLRATLKWDLTGQSNDGRWYAWYTIDIDVDDQSRENEAKRKASK